MSTNVRYVSLVLILVLAVLNSQQVSGQSETKTLRVQPTAAPPRIDGHLKDACWKGIEPVSGFFQFDPVNGSKASEETYVWSVYNKNYIYFAFLMKDAEPGKIWAELTPRNSYEDNDSITVILDTYNDKRTSIQFTVNPRGVQSNSVETIWLSGATVREDGWCAEIAIPFKSLRFSTTKKQVWGINFERYISRLKERDFWTNVNRDISHLQQLGTLTGLEGVKPSYNLEFFPYFGGRLSRWEGEKDDKMALGLDFKYGILPNLILDMTASPDFSEVESDPFIYQFSPYENYLEENRPFFSEGSQYFGGNEYRGWGPRSEFNLFYSRRIRSPRFAAKVTGKTGGFSFGLLGAFNKGDEEEETEDNFFSVIRIKKDIFKNSQIGIYYTGMDEADDYNRNFGLDYNFNFKDIYYIRGQSAFSFNKHTGNKKIGMHVLQLERQPDAGLQMLLNYRRVEENVDVRTGYIDKIDSQFTELELGYAWRFNKKQVKRVSTDLQGNLGHDCQGNLTRKTLELSANIEFLSRLEPFIRLRTGESKYQLYNEEENLSWSGEFIDIYGCDVGIHWYRSGFFKSLDIRGEWDHKGIYNEDYSAVEGGIEIDLDIGVTFRPRSNLEFTTAGKWTRQTIDRTGEAVFNDLTYKTSLHYQITRSLFLNTRLQGETRNDQYNLDVLVGYYFGAGNIIQLSYKKSSRLEDMRIENGYSLTLKVSYLLRI
ncbi:MAG: carbohydrate binding family 9 domain-containing protein [Candidatus Aminicenantes bacterium]|nr:MAG: carbohydrate binding family 9 domain-containing protein [Candidatus Aminicenantes bacterium]